MANPEHVAILKQDHGSSWNEWRQENPGIEPDLSRANLIYANLSYLDLSFANLHKARLSNATLCNTELSNADLSYADLSHADLSRAKLRLANLKYADLSKTNLCGADLCLANLSNVQAVKTRFRNAVFTYACIAGWKINEFTDFTDVQCDAIYLGWDQANNEPTNRFPYRQNDTFAPGEFVHFISQTRDLIELEFKRGVHCKAFLYSFQELQKSERYGELFVQGINRKSDQSWAVIIDASVTVDKMALEREFRVKYESMLNVKDRQIDSLIDLLDKATNQKTLITQEFNAPVYGVTGQTETQVVNASVENVSG